MSVSHRPAVSIVSSAILLAGFSVFIPGQLVAETPEPGAGAAQTAADAGRPAPVCEPASLDSPYIPVDSWVYPAILRLYALGFVDTVYLGMRPWTRSSVDHMLEEAGARIEDARLRRRRHRRSAGNLRRARSRASLRRARPLRRSRANRASSRSTPSNAASAARRCATAFTSARPSSTTTAAPIENGFNNYSGASGYACRRPLPALCARRIPGRAFRHGLLHRRWRRRSSRQSTSRSISSTTPARQWTGPTCVPLPYQSALHHPTRPHRTQPPMAAFWRPTFRRTSSITKFPLAKQDDWLGPGLGAGMAYSNNAENIYSFRINRIEPLHVPGLSYITGPFRYEFLIGGRTATPTCPIPPIRDLIRPT